MQTLKWVESKRRLMRHFLILKEAWSETSARVLLNVLDFIVYIDYQDELISLYPQFKEIHQGKGYYTTTFSNNTVLFLGWRPYSPREIPWMTDKWIFKQWLIRNDIDVPAASSSAENHLNNVIIKLRTSSFGQGIRGPYASNQQDYINPEKEYYEQLIFGDIYKIWFWNDSPVVLEKEVMPTVTGNGQDTLKTLLEKRAQEGHGQVNWQVMYDFLKYRGLNSNNIIPAGEKIWVDFRYGSAVNTVNSIQEQLIIDLENKDLQDQFEKIGHCIYQRLKNEKHVPLVYTIDAIVDNSHKAWFLECNANPIIHPQLYFSIANHFLSNERGNA